ncbi:MAG: hypothetical protein EPN21_12695, partial [Methylococcaceae bacterium]
MVDYGTRIVLRQYSLPALTYLHPYSQRNSKSMLTKLRLLAGFIWLVLAAACPAQAADQFKEALVSPLRGGFSIINYHDIIDEEERVPPFDRVAVSKDHFESHFIWLKKQGYHVIGVQDLVDAAVGSRSLPDKAVLLVFDDGFQSFYSKVFPLLKKYRYPATVALVGAWMDGKDKPDMPGNKQVLSWDQVRELAKSGLVEIASHSYGLHQGIAANPQGNEQAAAITRRYDANDHGAHAVPDIERHARHDRSPHPGPLPEGEGEQGRRDFYGAQRYEDDEAYRRRIGMAMEQSAEFIFQNAGIRPRVMVWPYGEYNDITLQAAKAAGMPYTMGLNDGANTLADLGAMRRLLIADDPDQAGFADIVTGLRAALPQRVAHVDLDYIFDPEPARTEINLGKLIERIRA